MALLALKPVALVAAALTSFLCTVHARLPDGRPHANFPPHPIAPIVRMSDEDASLTRFDAKGATQLPPLNTTYYFDQLIDHANPSLGTFTQRYWHRAEFYESGGPIILMTPGEANAAGYTGYLTNRTINGQIAQAQKGATIVLEHRFFGESNPFPDLSVESFQYHTIQHAINDLEYFAKNVQLPQRDGDNVKPGQAPWVLVGGSYSGALTSYTMVNKPGLFQAGYASSAVVESIVDYWGYFEPIRQWMPKNCSADVQAVIAHIDAVFTSNDQHQIDSIKRLFNMTALEHLDDFVGALRNNLWDWQSLLQTSNGGTFYEFCDALEVKNGKVAGPKGWGLAHALQAWGSYWTNKYLGSLCGDVDIVDCLGTYDPTQPFYTNTTVNNSDRSWTWLVCNEVGYFFDGAPKGHPSLVSRLIQPIYDERQCKYWFPEAYAHLGRLPVPNVDKTNKAYDGWFVKTERLFFANGKRDPWREATVAADGTHFPSTPKQPHALSDGFHATDLLTSVADVDPTVKAVQQQALKAIDGWLKEWRPSRQ